MIYNLIKCNLFKQIWEIKNNKFRIILGLFISIVSITALYYNSISSDGTAFFGLDYQSAIVVFIVLSLVLSSFSQTGNIILNESRIGTIEQLILSPFGLRNILITRLFIQSISIMSFTTIVIIISNIITKNTNSFDFISFLLTSFIGLLGLYGIGIILAGISLISKEINLLSALVKIGITYSIIKFDENLFIPFSYAKSILVDLLLNNNSLFSHSLNYLGLFILTSIFYFVLGVICFRYIEKIALKKGKIIGY